MDDDRTCQDARIYLGVLGLTATRVTAAEDALRGQPVTTQHIDKVREAVMDIAQPNSDMRGSADYKRQAAGALAKLAVEAALQARSRRTRGGHASLCLKQIPRVRVSARINGKQYAREVEPRTLLVQFLREELSLTGTHIGCDTSYCGACTVLLNGKSVKSCTVFAFQADGGEVLTVEGLAKGRRASSRAAGLQRLSRLSVRLLHARLSDEHAATARRTSASHRVEIRKGIAGNTCRCTGYQNIFKAIRAALRPSPHCSKSAAELAGTPSGVNVGH